MTLKEALKARNIKASEFIRRAGISRPTIYHLTSKNETKKRKGGARTETLAIIAKILNAEIVIDESKPCFFDIILKEEKNEKG